jgi:undecaprenyl-diphosphatase
MDMNQVVFLWIHNLSGHIAFFDYLAIFFADWLTYFLVLAFLILVYYQIGTRQKLYLLLEGTLAVILSRGILTTIIRFFYVHPRPFDVYGFTPLISESGSSFPSGHMAWFFALALVVWYADRRSGAWFLVLTAIMGVARIYVGVHWPYDILGGAALGLLCGWSIHALLKNPRKALAKTARAIKTE